MSFGGFGGGGSGFGSSNNNNPSGGFGGFGATANNNTSSTGGFGASANTGAGGGLFGSGGTTSGFGTNTTGAFGSTSNTGAFGAKPATGFGTTTSAGGGLFGGSSTPAAASGGGGFGGFGSTNNNTAATSSPFGGGSGSSLFGNNANNKPAFGTAAPAASGGLFGSGGANTTTTTSAFGGFGNTANNVTAASGDPPGTANTTNFQPFVEKEGTGVAQNSFQNICFQDPYKKWSQEELRLVDYAAGRRHGGAAGGNTFGVSSGFGSFGSNNQPASTGFGTTNTNTTGGGLFGNTSSTGGAFGQTQNTASTGAFGSNTGGGMFGNTNKPAATGGLFGNTATTTQPAQTGGLFGASGTTGFGGSTGTTTGGFGSANNNASGGLFGSNNTQNKTGFSFGNAGTTGTGFGGGSNAFGATNTNNAATTGGGGLFGNSAAGGSGGGLFNNSTQPATNTFGNSGGFGAAQNQQQQQGGGLFGNAQKPAGTGLFGNSTANTGTGGGLFGNTANATSGFGASSTAQSGGGLFGNKPATGPTGGLFGGAGAAQNTNTGGGLFGGQNQTQQPQQQQSGGLFGSLNQSQPKPGGLFGAATPSTGGGMFGGQNTQQQGSMFGSTNTQQPQNSTMGGSLFGNSQGPQSNAPSLTASINDPSAFGSLFANFGTNEAVNPGPLATPTNKKQSRRPSILPYYRLNPASASRLNVTPQKRGFGLSYSTYGTPNSPSSAASTPGSLSQSLLGGSLSRNLGKSISSSNLRRSFNVEDSVLVPGAFSASTGPRMYNNGSVKKLVINKDLRSDLFSTPTKEKPAAETPNTARKLIKRVSFDTGSVQAIEDGSATNGSSNSTPSADQLGYVRPKVTNGVNGAKSDATPTIHEMEQVKGNELAVVHERQAASPPARDSEAKTPSDGEPGNYWMSPTKDELQNMNRVQRQKVADLTVGRQNVGFVKFKVPVDLTAIDIETICDKIVLLTPRSATVYPVSVKKPPVGKGLNVPALISLEHAWPRASRNGRPTSVKKHVDRLKKIEDTTFESYNPETGEWSFSVEHFTTYGLDDSDDEDEEAAPESSAVPSHHSRAARSVGPEEEESIDEVTKFAHPPGAFEPEEYNYSSDGNDMAEVNAPRSSFLADRSAGSASHGLVPFDQATMDDEYVMSEVDDASDHLGHHLAAEHDNDSFDGSQSDLAHETPAGIMRARMRAIKSSATPVKVQVAAGDDWMDMLSKTISPQKRDRALLKSIHELDNYRSARDSVREPSPTKKRTVSDSKGFATSIDLMNSLFEKAKTPTENFQASVRPQGVKWPYKRVTKHLDESDMDSGDRTWHDTIRPTWGPGGTLIFSAAPSASAFGRSGRINGKNGLMTILKGGIVSETQDIRIAKFTNEMSAKAISNHAKLTQVHVVDGIPAVTLNPKTTLKDFSVASGTKSSAEEHERLVWEVASVLFDNVKIPAELQGDANAIAEMLRRENLSRLWESMVEERTNKAVAMAHTHEEKALAALSGHRVAEACKYLLEGKNFRLATLVSLIGTDDSLKMDMREQVREWQDANVLSEFSQPIRALYEMLGGNVCECDGTKGALENRAESFSISKRFGLDWQQAFGLRLWYAISKDGGIAEAFDSYQQDIEQYQELRPIVWFAQHGISAIWEDPHKEDRQDLLWGLLKLHSDTTADLESVIRPENSQLSPLDYRLCWQLGQALASTGRSSFGKNGTEKADAATISFAAQLTNESSWLEAAFVFLHLSDSDARAKAIQDHLCRHAALIGNEDSASFRKLAFEFKIPTQWIWHSKALHMRSARKDATGEVQCLLRAESWAEAHQTFVKEVAPRTVIERDYDGLADVLQQFEGRHLHVPDWNVGGEIYKAFLQLMGCHRRSEAPPLALVNSLLEGLPAMHGNTPEAGVEEYAALTEMAAEVAKIVTSMAKIGELEVDSDRILSLPLTEDVLLKHSRNLAWSHYSAVMARA